MQAIKSLLLMTASSFWPMFWPSDPERANAAAIALANEMSDALAGYQR